jgi:hypothetical protein
MDESAPLKMLVFVQLAGAWKYGFHRSHASLRENTGGNGNGVFRFIFS